MNPNFTPEQVKDIREREVKALAALKDLKLTPACQASLVNLGDDTFAIKLQPYLNDTKFTAVESNNAEVNPTI